MKRFLLLYSFVVVEAFLVSCATGLQRPTIDERLTEDKIIRVQGMMNRGIAIDLLTRDEGRDYQERLHSVRYNYSIVRKAGAKRDLKDINNSLDELERALYRKMTEPERVAAVKTSNRIFEIQRRIDSAIMTGILTQTEGRQLQTRLDATRGEYLALVRESRLTVREHELLLGRLDVLEKDLDIAIVKPRKSSDDAVIDEWIEELRNRAEDGLNAGILSDGEAREIQNRIDSISQDVALMRDRAPLAGSERDEILIRLEGIREDINYLKYNLRRRY